ncbi:hypothetical protein HOY80DRAFT_26448 [Tuber brumale]|nr:hypothetical protein HOY80DRAFT_26448 [Tuber brumale]
MTGKESSWGDYPFYPLHFFPIFVFIWFNLFFIALSREIKTNFGYLILVRCKTLCFCFFRFPFSNSIPFLPFCARIFYSTFTSFETSFPITDYIYSLTF